MLRRMRTQRGIAAIEFGLVMPIVLVILFAIFEFGMAFWRKQVLTSAVREGARKGIVATNPRKTEAEIQQVVFDYLDGVGYKDGARTVQATGTGAGAASGDPLTVTATYPTSFLILSKLPLADAIDKHTDGTTVTLTATITMQME